ncbi:MAG: hypothetical protein ABW002_13200 [Xanthomonas sp.]
MAVLFANGNVAAWGTDTEGLRAPCARSEAARRAHRCLHRATARGMIGACDARLRDLQV